MSMKRSRLEHGIENSLASDGQEFSSQFTATYVDVNVDTHGSTLENSTAAVLNYCKAKVLRPYFQVLSTLGWRPLVTPRGTVPVINFLSKIVNLLYSTLIIALILSGYFLQYCICYRGDGLHHLMVGGDDSYEHFCSNMLPIRSGPPEYESILSNIPVIFQATENLSNDTTFSNPQFNSSESQEFSNFTGPGVVRSSISMSSSQVHNCNSKIISHFIIPDLLHFMGYVYVFYLMRNPDCERLENLMERGFLQTSRIAGWLLENRRLVNTLRTFLFVALVWTILSISLHLLHFSMIKVCFPCFPWSRDKQVRTALVYITVASLACFDIICIAVVTSYAVHCQLNISYIHNLCRGVREKRINLQEFYKRVEESRKFLSYLNNDQALGVFLLLVVFVCKICIFLYELISKKGDPVKNTVVAIGFFLWSFLLLVPLIQGVRLTSSCKKLKRIGHELRSRPFGYQDMERPELDSLLLYTSTLDMEAKIFHIPMRSSSLILLFLAFLVFLPLLGQINLIPV